MKLFNTQTGQKETFTPLGGRVGFYVCGITPYDVTHLGHAFNYVFYDTLRKYLKYQRLRVDYVQNITDIDDDIIRKAGELRLPVAELVKAEVTEFHRDMRALRVDPPTHYPSATEHIAGIISLAEGLVRRERAYARGGNVFFRVSSFPEFGRLSGRTGEALVSETELERLRSQTDDPRDFTLWQESLPGEPHWTSPWGEGRPGWHSECAVMATEFLGTPVDIHGGGRDLIFPHHESEIAEVESFGGVRPFVRCWVHVGMLRLDGVKMSKSLGNLVVVDDLLKRHNAAALRAYLLSHHYRSEPEYRESDLAEWGPRMESLRRAASLGAGTGEVFDYRPYERRFLEALDDDMDTPLALEVVCDWAAALSAHAASGFDPGLSPLALRSLSATVLGLSLD